MSHGRPNNALCIELLGGFRISYGSDEIRDDGWRLAKARSLVKIVALTPEHSILREQLVELLWPELDPDSGSNNLHQALHVARRTLGSLIPDAKPNELLRLRRGVINLAPPLPVWVDLTEFEKHSQQLADSRDPAAFYAALDLYRGDLLPDDLYEDWAFERRLAAREQYLSLLDRLSRLHIARQEAVPAIDALRRVVAIEPDEEDAHRTLMELYALTGRRQQALRQYERLRDILERELDLEPEPETDELYEAIQSGEFPSETWEIKAPETTTQPVSPEIKESIADFLQRAGDFVGRGEELATLQGALERVIGGKGEVILIAGEPGIGKTRMTEEFLRYANAQGVRTLWGRCYEGDGAPAYWPWVQIVRSFIDSRSTAELRSVMGPGAADIARIAPEVRNYIRDLEEPPQLDADGERFRLFDSMTTFLKSAAGRAPLALIIDDLHTADRSSLLLFEFLAREIAETGLLIIGTYRHVEVDRSHPLTRTLGQLARQDITERITLEGLTPGDIERYITLTTGRDPPEDLAEAIHDQSEGNPFFVREIVHLLIDEERLDNPDDVRSWRLTIPPGIRETIALRTARLSETAHKVLTTASVSGRDFELPIVAQVADLDEMETLDGLDEALRVGLVSESQQPAAYRFTHSVTRETIYSELNRRHSMQLHFRTARALEDRHREQEGCEVTRIAHHYLIAAPIGGQEKAAEYLELAGAQSMKQAAFDEAKDYFRRALDMLEQTPSPAVERRGELLLSLGLAENASWDTEKARQTFRRVAALALEHGSARLLAHAAVQLSDAVSRLEWFDEGEIALLKEANNRLGQMDEPDPSLRARVLSCLARSSRDVPGETQYCEHWVSHALAFARASNDSGTLAHALLAKVDVTRSPDKLEELVADAREAAALAHASSSPQMELIAYGQLNAALFELGDRVAGEAAIDRYAQLAAELRIPKNLWVVDVRSAMLRILSGDLQEGDRISTEAYQLGQVVVPRAGEISYLLQQHVIRRERKELYSLLPLASAMVNEYPNMRFFQCLKAHIAALAGDAITANRELDDVLGDQSWIDPSSFFWCASLALLAETLATMQRSDSAADLYHMLLPHRSRVVIAGPTAVVLGPVALYLAKLAPCAGAAHEAEGLYRQASTVSSQVGAPIWKAWSDLGLARERGRQRRSSSSDASLDQLLEEIASLAANVGSKALEEELLDLKSELCVPDARESTHRPFVN